MPRTHGIDVALFVHVAGAMILMGGLVTAAAAGIVGWRDTGGSLRRLSALTLFAVALHGWDDVPDKLQPTWLGIGYIKADAGGIILLVALILGGIGVRRARSGGGAGLLKASTVLATILIAVYVVTVWAMGGKPN